MKHLFFILSTERKNEILCDEVAIAKENIQKLVPKHLLSTISLTSILLSSKSLEFNDVEILEHIYDLTNEEVDDVKELFNDQTHKVIQEEEEEFIANDFYKLSEYLHAQADTCCEVASARLSVIWIVHKYMPCPSEVIEFYACLQRFKVWHNGSLNIVTKNAELGQDWLQFLPFNIASTCSEVIKNELSSIWRGSLALSVQEKVGFTLYPEVTLTPMHNSFSPFGVNNKKEATNSQYVLPVCEVFSDINLGSIPWSYIQRGSVCKLEPSPCLTSEEKNDLGEIFDRMVTYQGVGTLIRIRYSNSPPHSECSLTSQEWKSRIAEGHFDLTPSFEFKGHHHCLVLVVLPDCATKDRVYCLALQDPSAYGQDIVKLVMQESLRPKLDDREERSIVTDLLKETCELNNIQSTAFSHLILNLPSFLAKHLEKTNQKLEHLWDDTKLAIERAASRELVQLLFANAAQQTEILPVDKILPPEISVNKECWPEYEALEKAEQMAKKSMSRRVSSGDFLCGIAPPPSFDPVAPIDASHFLKFFRDDGRPVEQKLDSSGLSKECHLIKANVSLNEIKKINWAEVLHLRHHGIYYNVNEDSEKFERRCNRLKERYIRSEFSSTCTTFHEKTIVNFASSSKSIKLSKESTTCSPKLSNGKSLSEIDSASVRSGSSYQMRRTITPRKRLRASNAADIMLRRSPRKRAREELEEKVRPSDLLNRPSEILKPHSKQQQKIVTKVSKPPKPAILSELHKQKLRNVILNVLDEEGIGVKNVLFKQCFKKMFMVCKPFALDVIGRGSTTKNLEAIAKSHVKQVIHFEKKKSKVR